MSSPNCNLHKRFILILITFIVSLTFCSIKYPVSIGGFNGDTILQLFAIDKTGNLAVESLCSDLSIVSQPFTNTLMYYPSTSNSWLWGK